ncbi:MAG: hypothetical protein JRN35_09260 [Nitrososphaerota archaeon]|nr:hypothetical protein [Nitrososphaerota archaeon]
MMVEKTGKRRARWKDGETLDITEEMISHTLEIVAKTLFGSTTSGGLTNHEPVKCTIHPLGVSGVLSV